MKPNTRRQLLSTAMKVLNTDPSASMERIAEEAHVSRMTLFRTFKNRQGLIEELVLESYKVCSEIILRATARSDTGTATGAGTASEKLAESVREMMPVGAMFRFLLYGPWRFTNPIIIENDIALRQQWHNLLKELQEEKTLRADLPLAWLARSLDSLLIAAWESLESGDIAINTAHEYVLKLFFYGASQYETNTKP